MQDFPEQSDLGNGFSWTAQYKSWDWAHYGRFYFLINIHQGAEIIKQLKVFIDDYGYGDSSCKLTDAEFQEIIRAELHSLALRGESTTEYV
jgi:hypothetical protein